MKAYANVVIERVYMVYLLLPDTLFQLKHASGSTCPETDEDLLRMLGFRESVKLEGYSD